MHSKLLSMAAFASLAAAQSTMNLTAALSSNPQLTNLTKYLGFYPQVVQQLSTLTDITLLAPNNAAFTKLLSGPGAAAFMANDTSLIDALFTYHVLNGTYRSSAITTTPAFVPSELTDPAYTNLTGGQVVEAVMSGMDVDFYSGLLQKSTVTQANINFTGGVIHVIDNFLTIPQNISSTLDALNETAALGAIVASGVTSGPLPANLTAFIPNNAAFQAIGSALANATLEQLQSIIAYHIVPDVVGYSSDLKNGTMLNTLGNSTVTITIDGDKVFVNSAQVIIPNVLIAEGVVHVIDNVLNPMDSMAKPNLTASTQMPAFSGASSASTVPFTSGIPVPTAVIATPSATSTATASGAATSSSKSALAAPMKTGAVGAAALFGGAALMLNM